MTVGVGVIGAGHHGRHHMKELARLPGARLLAVFDVDAGRAAQAVRDVPSLRQAASVAALLDDPAVEAVVIATPAETHRDLALASLRAGRHVLLEKPMAHTPDDAEAIAAVAADHTHLVLLVGHCERFNRSFIDAKRAVDEGRVGAPRFAWASRLSPLHLNDPAWALGTLDTAVHDIDILLWLIGDDAISVTAQGTTANPDLSIPDHVTYTIQFAGGALAHGHIGWVPFGQGYPLRGNAHPRLFLAGSAGTLTVDLWQRPVAVHSWHDGAYFWPDDVLVGYGDYATEVTAQDSAFLRAVDEGLPLPLSPGEAARALRVAHAAHVSLTERDGAPVSLPERGGA